MFYLISITESKALSLTKSKNTKIRKNTISYMNQNISEQVFPKKEEKKYNQNKNAL